ncbi:hypothetical protein SAMN05421670_3311 [Psychrobacillus psychrotolerans]|uniref:Phr family secreted Rap phosphatase inhibitor n=1 Tax=Psychrobacillus psychrotolerans TaxID=126156 RepID=A0A1I6ADW5_9BACI|nr:hypothetical protein [Psychrobacillus psychrotolerans]SFQ66832.1 hypothetical protein SAMN05421670_3311 [Psychrobacillus psychrotolerans]
MKKKIVLLTLSSIVVLALSFTTNIKHISEDETPRPTSIDNSFI